MAAGMTDEKWLIDRLDGTNWTTWKFQMRHLLLSKGLWGIIDGTDVLEEGANAQAQSDHTKRSQKAFSSIVMAVGTSQLYLITSTESPVEAWETLRNHFERDTLANKLFLKKKYFRTEMKESTTVEDHLKHMKEITDRLAAIGAPIVEEDQVVTLLGSLPRSYSTLVTALEARGDDLTFNFVKQALVQEEQKRLGVSSDSQSALISSSAKKTKYVPRKQLKCFGCGQIGHIRRNCTRASANRKEQADSSVKLTHNAKTANEHDPKESLSTEEADSVFAASSSSQSEIGKWLIDSGASSHMTNDQEVLTGYQKFEHPEKVGLGDGRTVDALGIGKVYVNVRCGVNSPCRVKRVPITNVLYVPELTRNLFSVRAATSNGNSVRFGESKCWIRNAKGKLCGMGTLMGKLYQLDSEPAE